MIESGVKSIDLGSSDAESDDRLGEYFVTTPYVTEALSGRKTLFIGRKGSGKSALFREFPRLIGLEQPDLVTVSLTPDAYLWDALRGYREKGVSEAGAHRNAWKLTLAVNIASVLVEQNYSAQSDAEAAADVLRRFLKDNFGDSALPKRGALKVLKGIRALNVSAFGFGGGLNRDEVSDQDLTSGLIDKLFELIAQCVDEVGVVVLLDRLDEEWDGSDDAETLLIALLVVAKSLNDELRPKGDRAGLKVLVFLRTDIYAGLGARADGPQFDDQDKHRGTEQPVIWTVPLLREMLDERLPGSTTVDDLFEPGGMRGESSAFGYVVTRTFLRPREVIQFVEECQRLAPADAKEISKDVVRQAENRYSRWKVQDLKREFARVHPELSDLLDALQGGYQRYNSLEELAERIRTQKPQLAETADTARLLRVLFEASVIGYQVRGAGRIKYRSEDLDLELPTDVAVSVHQSLRKGLGIVERRDRTGTAAELDQTDDAASHDEHEPVELDSVELD